MNRQAPRKRWVQILTAAVVIVWPLVACTGGAPPLDAGAAVDGGALDAGVDGGTPDAGVDGGIERTPEQLCEDVVDVVGGTLPRVIRAAGEPCVDVSTCIVRSADIECPSNPDVSIRLCAIALDASAEVEFDAAVAELTEYACALPYCFVAAQCEDGPLQCNEGVCEIDFPG